MKLFSQSEVLEAYQHAASGAQALHVWNMGTRHPSAPRCFKPGLTGHLFDRDIHRLEMTARRLGVKKIVIHHAGGGRQHVDLTGVPLQKATKEAAQ